MNLATMERLDVGELTEAIEKDGYVICENVLTPEQVAEMRAELDPILEKTPTGRNAFEGYHTKRIYSPLARTRVLDPLILSRWTKRLADTLIGPHTLSSIIGIQIGPGEKAQEIHYDAAAYPLPRSHDEVVFNTMWALDDFTVENGATVVYPGSNSWQGDEVPTNIDPVQAVMPAGSLLIWTGKTFHGGGANRSDAPRFGVIIEYVAGYLRSHENIQAAMPRELVRELPERMQELVGYHLYPAFLGFVDGRHPRSALTRDIT